MSGSDHQLRAEERRVLAREVSDAVTHRLATVSLQVMSHLDCTEPDDLRQALLGIGRTADSALAELRVLVKVLRDESGGTGDTELVGLAPTVSPTASGAAWTRRFSDAGYEPTVEIPVEADGLEVTMQRTIGRVLDVSGENILRHGVPGSSCSFTVVVQPTHVVVRTASVTSPERIARVYDRALLGLQERVDLVGGTFTAGPPVAGTGEWVVVATLPRNE